MRLPYRLWFYFRIGNGNYLGLFISLVQFLLISALYVQKIPEFTGVHLYELAGIFVVPYSIASVLIGWMHKRKQMETDTMISALSNPYLFRIQPGKEEKIQIPLTLLNLRVQKAFMQKLGIMTPELSRDFDSFESLLTRLLSGEEIR